MLTTFFASLLLWTVPVGSGACEADVTLFWADGEGLWRWCASGEHQLLSEAPAGGALGGVAAPGDGWLYWTLMEETGVPPGSILRARFDGSDAEIMIQGAQCGMGKVLRPRVHGEWVYWHVDECGGASLARAPSSGGEPEFLETTPWHALWSALDTANGHIYWTARHFIDPDAYAIRRSDLDGGDAFNLIELGEAVEGIALDRVDGRLYWSQGTLIMSAQLDGQGMQEIIASPSEVKQIELEANEGFLYWSDPDRVIRRAPVDGTAIEVVAQLPPHEGPLYGFAVSGVKTPSAEPASSSVAARLEAVYPNPASQRLLVRFALDRPSRTVLEVRDILGRRVLLLANDELGIGVHTVEASLAGLAAGTYVVRLAAGDVVQQMAFSLLGGR